MSALARDEAIATHFAPRCVTSRSHSNITMPSSTQQQEIPIQITDTASGDPSVVMFMRRAHAQSGNVVYILAAFRLHLAPGSDKVAPRRTLDLPPMIGLLQSLRRCNLLHVRSLHEASPGSSYTVLQLWTAIYYQNNASL